MKSTLSLCLVLFLTFIGLPGIAHASRVIPFNGSVDLITKSFGVTIHPEHDSSLTLEGKPSGTSSYSSVFKIDRIKSAKGMLSTQMVVQTRTQNGADGTINGNIHSQYTLLDFKPLPELSGHFHVDKGMLNFDQFSWGPFGAKIGIELAWPYKIDSEIAVRYLELNDFMSMWLTNKKSTFAGYISGKLGITGDLQNIFVKGNFSGENIEYNEWGFDYMRINMEGYYPYVIIRNTQAMRSDGIAFNLTGPFDLSDQKSYKNQILSLNINPVVNSSEHEMEWTFKRLQTEPSGKTEIKYLRRKGGVSGPAAEDGSKDILGIQRTLEF